MTSRTGRAYGRGMETRLDIRTLDPYDDLQLRRFHEICWRAEKEDGRPWNAFWSYAEMAALFREQTDDQRVDGLCVVDGDRMLGGGVVGRSLLDNTDKAWVFPAVEPHLRGRGIGGAVLESLVERVADDGRTLVLAGAAIPYADRGTSPLLRFAEAHGFVVANLEIVRILPMPVAGPLLDTLTRESAAHHEGYRVETYVDGLPDGYLDAYCYLLNQLAADAPTGDVDFEAERATPEIVRHKLERGKRMGRTTYRSVALLDGEPVAHSDLFVLDSSTTAQQMGTLVRRDQRGHRLGTAVKVANLCALQQARPSVTAVHTQNAETNRWMVDINVRLGFEAVGVVPELVRVLG